MYWMEGGWGEAFQDRCHTSSMAELAKDGEDSVWADVLCGVGRVLCQRPVNMILFSICVICIQKMLYKFLFFLFCV